MGRGFPDWQSVAETSLLEIKNTLVQAGGPTGTTNVTLWTPAAGKRVRLLAYHVQLQCEIDGLGAGGTASSNILLQSVTPLKFIDRWRMSMNVDAGQNQHQVLDGGLSTLPGGGWPLPVDDILRLSVSNTVTGTGWTLFAACSLYGLEE